MLIKPEACSYFTYLCKFHHPHRNHRYNPFDCHIRNPYLYIHHYDIHIRYFHIAVLVVLVKVVLFELFFIMRNFFLLANYTTQLSKTTHKIMCLSKSDNKENLRQVCSFSSLPSLQSWVPSQTKASLIHSRLSWQLNVCIW